MRKFRIHVLILVGGWLPASAGGEIPEGVVYVCDSGDDTVTRFRDLDGSGKIEADVLGEIQVVYDDASSGPDLSVPSHLAVDPDGNLYLLDGGTLDTILVLSDRNGDGAMDEPDEFRVFYDNTAAGPRLATPNTLLICPDGSVLVADDGSSARRVMRLKDGDGDGNALDAGEAWVVYDDSNADSTLLEDPESLALGLNGDLYVGDNALGAVWRLVDLDDNGDFLGAQEAAIFFQGTGPLLLSDVEALATGPGGAVFAGDEDSGLVLRLEDVNRDGDAQDPGEVTIFVSSMEITSPRALLSLPGGGLLLADGRADGLFVAFDLNGDGDALDDNEVSAWLLDGGASLSTPSGVAFFPQSLTPPPVGFTRGDANDDRRVDISDAVGILDYLFLGAEALVCLDAMDADDSGVVNISDAIYVLSFLFSGGDSLPPPFPGRGPDPTADALECVEEP